MKSPEEKARELAQVWLVHAIERVVESLKDPDDIPCVLENAFTDGYLTARAEAAELVEACERVARFGFAVTERDGAFRNTYTELKEALANYKRGRE